MDEEINYLSFDVLLMIDFLKKCRSKANYKIYHIPLDLSFSSVMSDYFFESRRNLGYVYYLSLQSAIASLKDTGHVIIDYFFTDVGTYYIEQYPALKRTIANIPRQISAFFNIPIADPSQ